MPDKTAQDIYSAEWHDYLHNLTSGENKISWLPPDITTRIQEWQKRFDVYSSLELESFSKVNKWRSKKNFSRQGTKLKNALEALRELEESPPSDKKKIIRENLNKTIQMLIYLELAKLETMQLHMLERAQNLGRYVEFTDMQGKHVNISIDELETALHTQEELIAKELRNRDIPFSIRAEEMKLPRTFAFFEHYESKIYFGSAQLHSKKASALARAMNSLRDLFTTIANVVPGLAGTVHVLGVMLQAIPFINAIFAAIPVVITAIDLWLENKSRTKQAIAGILLAIAIGGIVTAGFATLASGIVSIGLIGIGTTINAVIPFVRSQRELRRKRKILTHLEQKIKNNQFFPLEDYEKQFLLVRVEHVWVKSNWDTEALTEAKKLILARDVTIEQLAANPIIKMALHHSKTGADRKLGVFLKDEAEHRIPLLKNEIEALKKQSNKAFLGTGLGVIAMVGVAFFCVPTPITWIIGASLLGVSAFVGLAVTFRVVSRIKNFFSGTQRLEPMEELSNKLGIEYTNQKALFMRLTQQAPHEIHKFAEEKTPLEPESNMPQKLSTPDTPAATPTPEPTAVVKKTEISETEAEISNKSTPK